MFAISMFLPLEEVRAFTVVQSQPANILNALHGLLDQLNRAISPQGTQAQTPAPTCSFTIPSSVASDTFFTLDWSSANATHVAYSYTGNDLYNSSNVLSPRTGDLYYFTTASTTNKMTATSGSATINFCFDQVGTSGTYADCLSRTPNTVCSQTVAIAGSSSADTQAPTAPSNLTGTAVSSSQIDLSWSPSTDNVGVAGYVVYTNGANPVSASLNTSYQVTGLSPSTSYSFAVISYDAANNVSPASNSINVSTQADTSSPPPSDPPPTGGLISWTAPIGIPHPGDWFLKTSGNMRTVPAGGGSYTFSGNGTAASPVIFQATGKPRFTGMVVISGSYVIVDSIDVDGNQVIFQGDHLALRNSEVHNFKPGSNSTTVYVNDNANNVVIYKNLIHDNGDATATVEIDVVGIGAGPGAQRIWIVDNTMYNHGGDSILLGHNQKNSVGYVYIGRNVMHHDRENAVDIKEVSNIVVSQNYAYGYRIPPGISPSAEGAAIVTHYCPINTHIINNIIMDSQIGISSASLRTDCPQVTTNSIMGNMISDIIGIGIQGWGSSKIVKIVNNTLYNIGGAGIDFANAISGSLIENNIFRNVTGMDVSLTGATMSQRNNIADTVNPMFVGEAQRNLKLLETSPAVNTGVVSTAYADYQNSIGVSAAYDIDGVTRPQGSAWDIGAYESSYTGTTLPTADTQAPTTPTGLTASTTSSSQINLSWTASTDNVGVAGYVIYRNGTAIGTSTTTTSYQATALTPSTSYSFFVVAYDATGNASTASNSVSATTLAADTPYPTPIIPKFVIGDRVQTTAVLNVRQSPSISGTLLGTQATAAEGVVLAGPTTADDLTWWQVNYDSGTDGWSVENYLDRIGDPLPPPPPTSWTAPIGIPTPSFGINETAPATPANWSTSVAGFYYIEQSNAACVDTENGYPARPRCTIPNNLPAGAVVELHGTYSYAPLGYENITGSGTVTAPIFIRGKDANTKPTITTKWSIEGNYIILENLLFNTVGRIEIGANYAISIRNNELVGSLTSGGIGFGSSAYIVIYKNYIHDAGDIYATYDQDIHCIKMEGAANNVWVLDNELARCSGDGVQVGNSPSAVGARPYKIYIGRNYSHNNKQTGLWTKDATDVIFSQNLLQSFRPSNSSGGACMGMQGDYPDYIWFIGNYMLDCEVGIGTGSANVPNGFFIGNVIMNVTNSDGSSMDNPHLDAAMSLRHSGTKYILNNTFWNYSAGIQTPAPGSIIIENNILGNRNDSQGRDIWLFDTSISAGGSMKNNIIFNSPARIQWGTTSIYDVAGFNSAFPAQSINTRNVNPLLVNPAGGDFKLQAGSPAIDTGGLSAAMAAFETRYPGQSIRYDIGNVSRPQGPAWDIGAYEFSGTQTTPPPVPPPPPPPTPSAKFTIGQRVQATTNINVRATADTTGTLLGTQTLGSLGTVTSGPVTADSFNWWQINYDTGADGYSAEDFLSVYSVSPPPPSPPPTNPPTTPGDSPSPNNRGGTGGVINNQALKPIDPSRLVPVQNKLALLSQRIAADPGLVNLTSYIVELQAIADELNQLQVVANTGNQTFSSDKFTETLYVGVRDPEVTLLQETLKSLGYYLGPITGYFGELTKAAVTAFQSARGLEPVGSVGPLTRSELNK